MIDVTTIKVGTRLALQDDVIAEVIENMEDGQWLQVRYLESPARPGEIGTVELCHAQDIVKVLSE
jgi:hypothetical protein